MFLSRDVVHIRGEKIGSANFKRKWGPSDILLRPSSPSCDHNHWQAGSPHVSYWQQSPIQMSLNYYPILVGIDKWKSADDRLLPKLKGDCNVLLMARLARRLLRDNHINTSKLSKWNSGLSNTCT
jgi:hypothetical protein